MADEQPNLIPRNIGSKNCDLPLPWNKHPNFDYIVRSETGDADYPIEEGCKPKLQAKILADDIQVTNNVNVGGNVTASTFTGTINVQSWKGFDIKHPSKPNHRLRHICLEGPEAAVYIRGRLTKENVINIPDYWKGLIDPETITVHLTQIGYTQELIVDKIEWGQKIIIKSGNGTTIDCFYEVKAARIDGEELIVEYEGETPKDYPGNSSQFSISGYDY